MQNYPYTFNARLLETFINLCMRCVLHVCTLYLDLWGVATSVYLLHVRRHIVRSNRLQSNKTDAFFFSFWILLLVWAFPSQRQQLANYNFNKAICTTSHTIVSRLAHFLSSFLCFSKYNKCTMTSLKAKRKKKTTHIMANFLLYYIFVVCAFEWLCGRFSIRKRGRERKKRQVLSRNDSNHRNKRQNDKLE